MVVADSAVLPAAADPTLQPFLQPDFDHIAYLNSTLPTLTTSASSGRQQSHAANLSTLSAETQSLLNRLNAQTTRLSNTLTQLTDEIIRSGGRLAYEVELLRGEAIGLTDALQTGLKDDIAIFMPQVEQDASQEVAQAGDGTEGVKDGYMERLLVLSTVRGRLDAVIKIFDDAMKWPIAPSEVAATSSSIISIAAPTNDEEMRALEVKAQAYAADLEAEFNSLALTDLDSAERSAVQRLEQLEDIAKVWQGTAEEKARLQQLDGLQRIIESKQKQSAKTAVPSISRSRTPVDYRYGDLNSRVFSEGSYNYLNGLRSSKD